MRNCWFDPLTVPKEIDVYRSTALYQPAKPPPSPQSFRVSALSVWPNQGQTKVSGYKTSNFGVYDTGAEWSIEMLSELNSILPTVLEEFLRLSQTVITVTYSLSGIQFLIPTSRPFGVCDRYDSWCLLDSSIMLTIHNFLLHCWSMFFSYSL